MPPPLPPFHDDAYFDKPREYTAPLAWYTGTWTAQNTYTAGSPLASRVVARAFAAGRLTGFDVTTPGTAGVRKVSLAYNAAGRLTRLADVQADQYEVRTVKYNSAGRLTEEVREVRRPGEAAVSSVARHRYTSAGRTTTVTTGGVRAEVVKVGTRGETLSRTVYAADGATVYHAEVWKYDGRRRLVGRTTNVFPLGGGADPFEVVTEAWTYVGSTARPRRRTVTTANRAEGSTALFDSVVQTVDYLAQPFPDGAGRPARDEVRTFRPGAGGSPVEVLRYVTTTEYDAEGRDAREVVTGTNLEDGVTRTNRTRTEYAAEPGGGTRTSRFLDLGADGTDDEEMVDVLDAAGRTVESRTNVPPGGPFTARAVIAYTAAGEVARREAYENNSAVPRQVIENVFPAV